MPQPKKSFADHPPTDAERRLKQEADLAKSKLFDEINQFKVDDNLEAATQAEVEDPRVKKFEVTNPAKVGGVNKYEVRGVDEEGDFTTIRRYREFDALAQVIKNRWPGIYVPSIPEKKFMQDKNNEFIEERRTLLERFMKECAKFDYIVFSKEFKLFARGNGEVDKVLLSLSKQTPMQVLEKYRLNFKLDEDQDPEKVNDYRESILLFQTYLRKTIPVMEMQKKSLKQMQRIRTLHDQAHPTLIRTLMKFEETGLDFYTGNDQAARVLNHKNNGSLKERFDESSNKWKNPYHEAHIWLKGEFLDVKGMHEALQGRETVMRAMLATEQKKKDDTKEMQKLSDGKTTLKSVFKSKSQKESSI